MLLPKDYVRLWLTGDYASDMSDSAGTLLARRGEARLVGDLLAATHLASRPDAGALRRARSRPESSARCSRPLGHDAAPRSSPAGPATTPLPPAASERSRPGAAFVSLGTSGVLFVSNEKFRPNAASAVHAFCHALPEHLAPDGRDPLGRGVARMAGAA